LIWEEPLILRKLHFGCAVLSIEEEKVE